MGCIPWNRLERRAADIRNEDRTRIYVSKDVFDDAAYNNRYCYNTIPVYYGVQFVPANADFPSLNLQRDILPVVSYKGIMIDAISH